MPPRSRTKQLLILIVGGLVLAFGGCMLFIAQVESNSNAAQLASIVGAIVFIAGLLMFAIGGIAAFVIGLTKLFGGRKAMPAPNEPPAQS